MGFFDWLSNRKRQAADAEWERKRQARYAEYDRTQPRCARASHRCSSKYSSNRWHQIHGIPLCEHHGFFHGKPTCQHHSPYTGGYCTEPVSRHEFTLCLYHWMQKQMIDKRMGKMVARRLNRTISPSKIRSYNRLIDTTSRYLGKPIEMCTDREVASSLIQNMDIAPREASAFINSDAVKGLAGWLPRIDAHGKESEGFEWTDFQGGKWYRSLTEPGPWTRYGAATQPPQTQQQPQQQSYNPPTHQSDAQTVIQNITYNIQDSAISGDLNADINRINDSEHQ